MNDPTRTALNEALDATVPDDDAAARDLEAILARVHEPRHRRGGLVVALAGAAALTLWLWPGPPAPAPPETTSPWMVVQMDIGDLRTDLRIRVRRPASPTPTPSHTMKSLLSIAALLTLAAPRPPKTRWLGFPPPPSTSS